MKTKPSHIKILMTGGHITPALATIEEIQGRFPSWTVVFAGRKTALEGQDTHSEEYRLVSGMGIKFIPVTAGRLKREGGLAAVSAFLKIPVGCIQAMWFIYREKPSAVVSFGGYVGLPVVLAAWLMRIPVVTHEQTTRPGLANRIIARMATKLCVTFPDTVSGFPRSADVTVTGLPIRKEVLHPPKKPPVALDSSLPLLFIVGGNTGSTSINDVVFRALPQLVTQFMVVHQVGRISVARADEMKKELDSSVRARYIPVPFVSTDAYSYLLHHAAVIAGRSGANTVTEVAISGKVALFIPLPWAAGNEQYYNAKVLETAGTALILEQQHFNESSFLRNIHTLISEMAQRTKKATLFAKTIPHDGAARFVDVISDVLNR